MNTQSLIWGAIGGAGVFGLYFFVRLGRLIWQDRACWKALWRMRKNPTDRHFHTNYTRMREMNDGSIPINCPGCGDDLITIPAGLAFGDPATLPHIDQMLKDVGAIVVSETDGAGNTTIQSYHSQDCRKRFLAQPKAKGAMGFSDDVDDDGSWP